MESPAQIRRLRELALARIERLAGEIAATRREIALYDELLRLHGEANRSNISSNMQAQTEGKSRRTKISAGRAGKETPSRIAAVAADLTDLMIADITGAGRSTVQAWHSGARSIPRAHAEKLAKRGIPASSWPKIQD